MRVVQTLNARGAHTYTYLPTSCQNPDQPYSLPVEKPLTAENATAVKLRLAGEHLPGAGVVMPCSN